jgi:Ni/Fe-hydrogenase 1 B-type cytochrome subunit
VLAGTGTLIGFPAFPTPRSEAVDHIWFGYVRFAHFAAGHVFAIGLLGRIYWALSGRRTFRR